MSLFPSPRILVTGATGRLGLLVVNELLRTLPASQIAALVREKSDVARAKAAALRADGVQTRDADYNDPAALRAAMAGVERLLLISGSELGLRVQQHRNAIEAAQASDVSLIAYTSVLRADRSPLSLADEHRRTEEMLARSGVPFVLLRNGWYTENMMSSIPAALVSGELPGATGAGRIASASRADYAAAAAAVMIARDGLGIRTYELAGDAAYTLAELAAEVSRQSGRAVGYTDLPEAEFRARLAAAGLPDPLATLLASSHAAVAGGALFDDAHDMSQLIGRPTTTMAASVGAALASLAR